MEKPLNIIKFSSPFLVTVEPNADLSSVINIMEEADLRHIPVCENDAPIGIISDRDLQVFKDPEFAAKFCAKDIMTQNPYTVKEGTNLIDVVSIMIDRKYGSCLVENEEGKITGIFTVVDALKTLKVMLNKVEKASDTQSIEIS